MFQSSPAPECGRYVGLLWQCYQYKGFNPRPHRSAGATVVVLVFADEDDVSILARTGVRALRRPQWMNDSDPMFQSSPAPECGRYDLSA